MFVRSLARSDVRTDGKFTPLSYRTSSPSGPLPKKLKTIKLTCLLILLHLAIRLSPLNYSYVMMYGLRATLYAIMLQIVLVQSQRCEEGKPKIEQNWPETSRLLHANGYLT